MDKEQIEKAAVQYAQTFIESSITAYRSFKVGAEWRINSVWHDNSEEPNLKDLVIVLTPNGGIFDFGFWEAKDKIREGQLWARMYDLIPCVLELDRLKVREKILSEEIIIDKLNINDTDNGRQRQ